MAFGPCTKTIQVAAEGREVRMQPGGTRPAGAYGCAYTRPRKESLLAPRQNSAIVVEVVAVECVVFGADRKAEIAAGAGVDLVQEARLGS